MTRTTVFHFLISIVIWCIVHGVIMLLKVYKGNLQVILNILTYVTKNDLNIYRILTNGLLLFYFYYILLAD
ncbi:hypothetical protein BN1088_1430578 [Sphingobacterium sp. PM2-P1-29]|nr:hypothetical protein BN1088_1430578 [Sphingobacterium sp. PM2-P1-29]